MASKASTKLRKPFQIRRSVSSNFCDVSHPLLVDHRERRFNSKGPRLKIQSHGNIVFVSYLGPFLPSDLIEMAHAYRRAPAKNSSLVA